MARSKPDGIYIMVRFEDGKPVVLHRDGSSTPRTARAFESLAEARRSQARAGGKIIKVTQYEVVE